MVNKSLRNITTAEAPKNEKGFTLSWLGKDGELFLQAMPKSKWNDTPFLKIPFYQGCFKGKWIVMQCHPDDYGFYEFEALDLKAKDTLIERWKDSGCITCVYIGNSKVMSQLAEIFKDTMLYQSITIDSDFERTINAKGIEQIQEDIQNDDDQFSSVDDESVKGTDLAISFDSSTAEFSIAMMKGHQKKGMIKEIINVKELSPDFPEIKSGGSSKYRQGTTVYNYVQPSEAVNFIKEQFNGVCKNDSLSDIVKEIISAEDVDNFDYRSLLFRTCLSLCGVNEIPHVNWTKCDFDHVQNNPKEEHQTENNDGNEYLEDDANNIIERLKANKGICPKTFTIGHINGDLKQWIDSWKTLYQTYGDIDSEVVSEMKSLADKLGIEPSRFVVAYPSSELASIVNYLVELKEITAE